MIAQEKTEKIARIRTTVLATGPEEYRSPSKPPEYIFTSEIPIKTRYGISNALCVVNKKTPWGEAQGERGVIMRSYGDTWFGTQDCEKLHV
jgi:hypothetical protein